MIALKFLNLDTLYNSVKTDKIILNGFNANNTDEIEELKEKLSTIYDSDTISLIPSCSCGSMTGEFLRGMRCSDCDTEVCTIYENTEPFIWFKSIDDMEFINPEFWEMVKKSIGTNIDYLRWISDTQYNPPITGDKPQKILTVIKSIPNFERSYRWLTKNMQTLLVTLAVYLKKEELQDILKLFKEQKKAIFSKHLPLQNKRMFIIEKTIKIDYANLNILDVIDIVLFFIKNATHKNDMRREQVMSRVCATMAKIHADTVATYLSKKGGIPRKHTNGFRSYFTCRAVIVPIVGKHDYRYTYLPWGAFVVVMRPHILNKLIRRGYTHIEANNMLYFSVNQYNEVINEIIDELVEESPYKAIPITINRNPSLLNGSTQTLLALPKKDPNDRTISFSILDAKNPNAYVIGRHNGNIMMKAS